MTGPRRRTATAAGPLTGLATVASGRRHALAITQQELSELAGVGLSSVRALESGSDTLTLSIALSILDALGLDVLIAPGGGSETTSLSRALR